MANLCAPVAQLDRASDYESEGRTFESFRARHSFTPLPATPQEAAFLYAVLVRATRCAPARLSRGLEPASQNACDRIGDERHEHENGQAKQEALPTKVGKSQHRDHGTEESTVRVIHRDVPEGLMRRSE